MIAALGLKRHAVAELRRQWLRPDPGSNDRGIDGNGRIFTANSLQAAADHVEANDPLVQKAAAITLESRGQAVDQPMWVCGVAILAHQHTLHILA